MNSGFKNLTKKEDLIQRHKHLKIRSVNQLQSHFS